MKGKYHIVVQNNKLRYELDIRRNITVIRGDSATGKTKLLNLLEQAAVLGEGSGVEVLCERPCRTLGGNDWNIVLPNIHEQIIFIASYISEPNHAREAWFGSLFLEEKMKDNSKLKKLLSFAAVAAMNVGACTSSCMANVLTVVAGEYPDVAYKNIYQLITVPSLVCMLSALAVGTVAGRRIRYKTVALSGLVIYFIGALSPILIHAGNEPSSCGPGHPLAPRGSPCAPHRYLAAAARVSALWGI